MSAIRISLRGMIKKRKRKKGEKGKGENKLDLMAIAHPLPLLKKIRRDSARSSKLYIKQNKK